MKIDNEKAFLAALQKPINLFLGAGFSTLSKDRKGDYLPIGAKLAEEIVNEFEVKHLQSLNLGQLYTVISQTQKNKIDDFLVTRFTVSEFNKLYCVLEDKLILSTAIPVMNWSVEVIFLKTGKVSTKVGGLAGFKSIF